MTKNLYVTPETEVLEVRFEENFTATGDGAKGHAGGLGTGEEYELG